MKMIELSCKIKYLQENSMIYVKDRKTGQLFDPWRYLGPKRRKLLFPGQAFGDRADPGFG
jgi:hypothetical protein